MNELIHTGEISCLVVEDDPRSREFMAAVLARKFKTLLLHEAGNLEEAEEVFYAVQPQLLLLDINLPDGNSFELLEKLYGKRQRNFKVIFITAYATYAVEAFRHSALDFLLKPVTPGDMEDAVARVLQTLQQETYYLQLETLFQNQAAGQRDHARKKIVLKTADQIHVVRVAEIYYARADNNYTLFFLEAGKKLLVSQPLKTFDEKLASLGFLRVHQSFLVNKDYIRSYRKKEACLVLEDDCRIPVSQGKKAEVMAYLNAL